jgi:hypothetical protein
MDVDVHVHGYKLRAAHFRGVTAGCISITGEIIANGSLVAYRYYTHFLGIKGAGHGRILADAKSPKPGECE